MNGQAQGLRRATLGVLSSRVAMLALLLILVLAWGATVSPFFTSPRNLYNLSDNLVELGILALALTPVIIAGEIDISVESALGLGAVLTGVLYQADLPSPVVFTIVLAVGALGGLLNGLLVTRARLPALVVTLGTFTLFRGIALILLGTSVVSSYPSDIVELFHARFLGLPVVPLLTVIFLALAFAMAVWLQSTKFGRRIYFTGMNPVAAEFSGIPVARLKTWLFVQAGVVSSIGGYILAIHFSSARADSGAGLLLPALTAVLLGGIDIFGGRGSVVGVVLAVYVVSILLNVQRLLNLGPEIGQITIGVLLLISVSGRSTGNRALTWLTGRRGAARGDPAGGPV